MEILTAQLPTLQIVSKARLVKTEDPTLWIFASLKRVSMLLEGHFFFNDQEKYCHR